MQPCVTHHVVWLLDKMKLSARLSEQGMFIEAVGCELLRPVLHEPENDSRAKFANADQPVLRVPRRNDNILNR